MWKRASYITHQFSSLYLSYIFNLRGKSFNSIYMMCDIVFFFVNIFNRLKTWPFILTFIRIFNHDWMFSFVKCSFCIYLNVHINSPSFSSLVSDEFQWLIFIILYF